MLCQRGSFFCRSRASFSLSTRALASSTLDAVGGCDTIFMPSVAEKPMPTPWLRSSLSRWIASSRCRWVSTICTSNASCCLRRPSRSPRSAASASFLASSMARHFVRVSSSSPCFSRRRSRSLPRKSASTSASMQLTPASSACDALVASRSATLCFRARDRARSSRWSSVRFRLSRLALSDPNLRTSFSRCAVSSWMPSRLRATSRSRRSSLSCWALTSSSKVSRCRSSWASVPSRGFRMPWRCTSTSRCLLSTSWRRAFTPRSFSRMRRAFSATSSSRSCISSMRLSMTSMASRLRFTAFSASSTSRWMVWAVLSRSANCIRSALRSLTLSE
mmetsp:Transcript_46475/g.145443  ORF Transcript_46475/g.145443 Transcript_46475/m.145443 type:complete len:333 (+) Transcript_46475:2840-3838(+)